MPMHPCDRGYRDILREDREAVILADQLGFSSAFIGEHLTDKYEMVTNSMLFLATLIDATSQIKLGTGTTNLSHTHPALIAAHASMFDHLSDGRFILGVSPGALPSDAEVLGLLDVDKNALFAESIDAILQYWKDEGPYEIGGPNSHFRGSTTRTFNAELGMGSIPAPLQSPRPEIVGTVVAPYSQGARLMGAQDFHPLSANFLLGKWVATHWPMYAEGAAGVGREASPAEWRVARTIFVADDEATAREYGRDAARSPYRQYIDHYFRKFSGAGMTRLFKADQEAPDESVTLETMLDELIICGTPSSVTEQLEAFREQTGDFGEIVYAGVDWADEGLARRSMELMATKVVPAL